MYWAVINVESTDCLFLGAGFIQKNDKADTFYPNRVLEEAQIIGQCSPSLKHCDVKG